MSARAAATIALAAIMLLLSNLPSEAGRKQAEPLEVEVPQYTQAVFNRYKDRIVKVQILEAGSGAKSVIGTGFFLSPEGLVMTNYHVISNLIYHPERYRAEVLTVSGQRHKITVMGIDVLNDLALVKTEQALKAAPHFKLHPVDLKQGTRLYSLGNPHDIGLSIVEGTYNGYDERSFRNRIHFTGSLNPGMSGGPAITEHGDVAGVNVASSGEQVAFLVPAEHALRLEASVLTGKESALAAGLVNTVAEQLTQHQAQYFSGELMALANTIELGPYLLPTGSAKHIECWGDKTTKKEDLYEEVGHNCNENDPIFLTSGETIRTLRFGHSFLKSEKLNRFRFFSLYENSFAQVYPYSFAASTEENVTGFQCETAYVTNQAGLAFKTVFCARAYKKLTGLYDVTFKAATLEAPDAGLETAVALSAVSFERAVAFSRRYLEAIRWKK